MKGTLPSRARLRAQGGSPRPRSAARHPPPPRRLLAATYFSCVSFSCIFEIPPHDDGRGTRDAVGSFRHGCFFCPAGFLFLFVNSRQGSLGFGGLRRHHITTPRPRGEGSWGRGAWHRVFPSSLAYMAFRLWSSSGHRKYAWYRVYREARGDSTNHCSHGVSFDWWSSDLWSLFFVYLGWDYIITGDADPCLYGRGLYYYL